MLGTAMKTPGHPMAASCFAAIGVLSALALALVAPVASQAGEDPGTRKAESQRLLGRLRAAGSEAEVPKERGAGPPAAVAEAARAAGRAYPGSGANLIGVRPDRAPGGGNLEVAPPPTKTRGSGDEAGVRIFRENVDRVLLLMTEEGFGAGILLGARDQILTNNHVVGHHPQIMVFFPAPGGGMPDEDAGRLARVTSVAPDKDLALLRLVDSDDARSPAQLGELSSIQVGSAVYAIGHPQEEVWTFTTGTVSQIRRDYEWMGRHRATVIQTQTPINPGNSGGPLFNERGEIVGVNSFMRADAVGLNFAVAADEIARFLENPPPPAATGEPEAGGAFDPRPRRRYDGDGDGRVDTYEFDRNGDGIADLWLYDEDGDGQPEAMGFDSNGNGVPDTVGYDRTGDGVPNLYHRDLNEDGIPDAFGVDYDGDGVVDRTGRL